MPLGLVRTPTNSEPSCWGNQDLGWTARESGGPSLSLVPHIPVHKVSLSKSSVKTPARGPSGLGCEGEKRPGWHKAEAWPPAPEGFPALFWGRPRTAWGRGGEQVGLRGQAAPSSHTDGEQRGTQRRRRDRAVPVGCLKHKLHLRPLWHREKGKWPCLLANASWDPARVSVLISQPFLTPVLQARTLGLRNTRLRSQVGFRPSRLFPKPAFLIDFTESFCKVNTELWASCARLLSKVRKTKHWQFLNLSYPEPGNTRILNEDKWIKVPNCSTRGIYITIKYVFSDI